MNGGRDGRVRFLAIIKTVRKKGVMDVSVRTKVASVLRKGRTDTCQNTTAGTLDKSISFGGHVSSRGSWCFSADSFRLY